MAERDDFQLAEYRTWQVVAKDSNDEPHIFDLEYERHVPPQAELDKLLVRQAPPLRITPSRAKIPERDFNTIIDLPDIQMDWRHINGEYQPIHDEKAMKVARMICQDLKPDTIVIGGDNLDMAALSRFEKDSNHFSSPQSLQMAVDGLSKFLGHLRAENPQSRIVMLEGNHEKRLAKYVLKLADKLYGLRRANSPGEWPVNTVPHLLRLDELGVEWVSGYPAAEFRYSEDLSFIHGDRVRSGSSTAALYTKEHEQNVVFHHIHRHEMQTRTTRRGRFITAAAFGTLASNRGHVPSYGSGVDDRGEVVQRFENWQQGIGVILEYPDGYLEMHPIQIRDGTARFMGREYQAT